ncbi:MAG TPA: hypothetical protein VH391_02775, partial [Solirubrobacterales bacterium]
MRKALNDNPVAQIAILGLLAVGVAFLLMTRVMHKSDSSSATSTTPTTGAATAPTDASTAAVPGVTTGAVPSTTAPSTGTPVAPDAGATASAAGLPSKFVAGPGMPKPVASAYADGKAIVLFVFRNHGIDDAAVRASVERLHGRSDLAVFVTHAAGISRYAKITEGVDV